MSFSTAFPGPIVLGEKQERHGHFSDVSYRIVQAVQMIIPSYFSYNLLKAITFIMLFNNMTDTTCCFYMLWQSFLGWHKLWRSFFLALLFWNITLKTSIMLRIFKECDILHLAQNLNKCLKYRLEGSPYRFWGWI